MAVRPATTPAITNDRMTAGPASGTALERITKMPVPIVAPTPNIVSWNSPIVRASSPVSVSVPVSAVIALTGLRRMTCCSRFASPRTDAIAPPGRYHPPTPARTFLHAAPRRNRRGHNFSTRRLESLRLDVGARAREDDGHGRADGVPARHL
jgi:hypothetical protein